MSLVKYNDRSIRNLTTAPAAAASSPGALVHIKTLTASSSATLSFVDGSDSVVLDNTYSVYKFQFINMHPASNGVDFSVGFRDGGSAYDATKTTVSFYAHHRENDETPALTYSAGTDLAQSTDFEQLGADTGNDNDQCHNGEMYLFNPSSTTFVKHFLSVGNSNHADDYMQNHYHSGYCNVTAAIDAVQFKFSSGNIDAGTIKMYGIKES
jgi:hypothetical protein